MKPTVNFFAWAATIDVPPDSATTPTASTATIVRTIAVLIACPLVVSLESLENRLEPSRHRVPGSAPEHEETGECQQIRRHVQEVGRQRYATRLDLELQREHGAEHQRPNDAAQRMPGGKNDERHRDEAATIRHAFDPAACVGQ